MERNPFAPDFDDLPDEIPVFPLGSALLLPTGQLPLNIFEPRYVQMIDDAMKTHRMIGMIQPAEHGGDAPKLLKTGCCGKITEFSETADGRYLITLSGLFRFDVAEELKTDKLYRNVRPDWSPYENDHKAYKCLNINRDHLLDLLQSYFQKEGMSCDWKTIDDVPDGKLITTLCMICPFESRDKQALLEADGCKSRAELFLSMLEMAVKAKNLDKDCCQWH